MRNFAIAVLRLIVVAGVVAWLGPSPVAAQHFSFGFSTGHHHHHHHRHHWHDHCFEPWIGVLYAPPPPVVREKVIYVEPPPRVTTIVTGASPVAASTRTATTPANGLPANTAAASTASAATSDSRVTIRNGAGVQLPVAFLVNGQDVELADGQARTFVGHDRLSVQYDRGGRFGSTQQELTAGDYEFRITATGWDLVRRVNLDRTAVRPNPLPEAR